MKKANPPTRRFNINKIKIAMVREYLESLLSKKLNAISTGAVEKWQSFTSIVYKVAKEKLGTVNRKPVDWFDENRAELAELMNNRYTARNMLNRNIRATKAKYETCCKLVKQKWRVLKNEWWQAKAAELHLLAETNDFKVFYQNMKAVWGPRVNHSDQLLAFDNKTRLTEKHVLLTRREDHFRTLLNVPSIIETHATESIEQLLNL